MCENRNDRKSIHLHSNLTITAVGFNNIYGTCFSKITNTTEKKKSRVFKSCWDQADGHEGEKEAA